MRIAALLLLLLAAPLAADPCGQPLPDRPALPLRGGQEYRVLLLGDSWSEFQAYFGSIDAAFASNGFPQYRTKHDATAISGTKTTDWITPARLALIQSELQDNPTIDTVHLHIGGNDLLAGAPSGWYATIAPGAESALLDTVIANIGTITGAIFAVRPDAEVLLLGYDYPNFADSLTPGTFNFCPDMFARTGSPTARQANEMLTRFDARLADFAATDSRIHHFSLLGEMQSLWGFPAQGIAPGDLQPPGDLDRPSPAPAMSDLLGFTDCIHLGEASYLHLGDLYMDRYYTARFTAASAATEIWLAY